MFENPKKVLSTTEAELNQVNQSGKDNAFYQPFYEDAEGESHETEWDHYIRFTRTQHDQTVWAKVHQSRNLFHFAVSKQSMKRGGID